MSEIIKNLHNTIKRFTYEAANTISKTAHLSTKGRLRWSSGFNHKLREDFESNINSAYISFPDKNNIVLSEYGKIPFFKSFVHPDNPVIGISSQHSSEVFNETYDDLADYKNNFSQIKYLNPEVWSGVFKKDIIENGYSDDRKILLTVNHEKGVCPGFYTIGSFGFNSYSNIYSVLNSNSKYSSELFESINTRVMNGSLNIEMVPDSDSELFDFLGIYFNAYIEPDFFKVFNFYNKSDRWLIEDTGKGLHSYGHLQSLFLTDIHNKAIETSDIINGENILFSPQTKFLGKINPTSVLVKHDSKINGTYYSCNNEKLAIRVVGGDLIKDSGIVKNKRRVAGSTFFDQTNLFREYHKCYTGTLTTSPYQKVKAIDDGVIFEYSFVDSNGATPDFTTNQATAKFPLYLKVKSGQSSISRLNEKLSRSDINDDIIHTIDFTVPFGYNTEGGGDPLSYFRFGSGHYYRSDFDTDLVLSDEGKLPPWLDDSLGDKMSPTRLILTKSDSEPIKPTSDEIKFSGFEFDKYDKMVIAGIAEVSNSRYSNRPVYRMFLTNHNSTNEDVEWNDFYIPTEVDGKKLEFINYSRYEQVRPVILHPGFAGYIKILNESELDAHSPSIDKSGLQQRFYEIEIPFGTGNRKLRINDTGKSFHGSIYYQSEYIPAGSEEISKLGHKMIYNKRPAFHGAELLKNPELYINMYDVSIDFSESKAPDSTVYSLGSFEKVTTESPSAFRKDFENLKKFSYIKFEIPEEQVYRDGWFSDIVISFTPSNVRAYDYNRVINGGVYDNPALIGNFPTDSLDLIQERQSVKSSSIPDVKRWLRVFADASSSVKKIFRNLKDQPQRPTINLSRLPIGCGGKLEVIHGSESALVHENLAKKDLVWFNSTNSIGYKIHDVEHDIVLEAYDKKTNTWDRISEKSYDYFKSPKIKILGDIKFSSIIENLEIPSTKKYNIEYVNSNPEHDWGIDLFNSFLDIYNKATGLSIVDMYTGLIYPLVYITKQGSSPHTSAIFYIRDNETPIELSNPYRYSVASFDPDSTQLSPLFKTLHYTKNTLTAYFDRFEKMYETFRVRVLSNPEKDMIPTRLENGEFEMRKYYSNIQTPHPDVSESMPVIPEGDKLVYYPESTTYNGTVVSFRINDFRVGSK